MCTSTLSAGSHPSTQTLAVVREPFASFDQPLRPLNQLVRQLGPGAVAVATDATQPATRAVVDTYTYTKDGDGRYRHLSNACTTFAMGGRYQRQLQQAQCCTVVLRGGVCAT
jgi:hypothetical protein